MPDITRPHPVTDRAAVIFDLDGTLVDTAADLAAALNRVLRQAGHAALAPTFIATLVGDGSRALVAQALDAVGAGGDEARVAAFTERFLADYTAHVAVLSRPYPGAVETLAALREAGFALGVCTNKAQDPSERLLAALGLDRFLDAIVGADAVARRKPDGGHVLATLARLGVAPARALMVGDGPNDVAAARAAGVAVVIVDHGDRHDPAAALGADIVVTGLAAVPTAHVRLVRTTGISRK